MPPRLRRIVPLLLALLGLAVYGRGLDAPFFYDDHNAIVHNPHLRSLWPLTRPLTAPPDNPLTARPVASLSLALNYAVAGLGSRNPRSPGGAASYRLTNVALHIASALALWGLLRRTLARTAPGEAAAVVKGLSLAVAAIWLVHPLNIDAVAYVTQRNELLMGLFFLLTLYCLLRGSESPRPRRWYAASVAACLLGMLSKEVMVAAPIVVFLFDAVFLAGGFRAALRRRWGLHLPLAATWASPVIYLLTTDRAGSVGLGHGISPLDYLRTQSAVVAWYLRLAWWPHPLTIHYHWPVVRGFGPVLPQFLALAAAFLASLWAVVASRRWAWAGFLGLTFFLVLAPTSSVLPNATEPAAERRMYVPLITVIVLVAAGGGAALRAALRRAGAAARWRRALAGGAAALAVAALSAATVARLGDFESEASLWRSVVRHDPDNPQALNALGVAALRDRRLDEALRHLRRAAEADPGYADPHLNLGNVLYEAGRFEEAVPAFEHGLRLNPRDAEGYNGLGTALLQLAKARRDPAFVEAAANAYRHALRLDTNLVSANLNLGRLLAATGDYRGAEVRLLEAARLDPDSPHPPLFLGQVYAAHGRAGEARRAFERALQRARASGQDELARQIEGRLKGPEHMR